VLNSHSTSSPARISTIVGDRPMTAGPPGFGSTHPHSLERSTPKTAIPSPAADSTAPVTSSRDRVCTGASWTRRARNRIAATITTSPTKTYRHEK
jgi:hypothetical protein